MEVRISDAGIFRRSVEALKEFLPQAQIHVSEEGIKISGMDVSHVGFVDFFLSSKDCDSLHVPEESAVIGISMPILARVLAMSASSEGLTLAESGDRIKVSFKTEGRSSQFELPTLCINDESVQLPDMDYSASVRARSGDISALIKDLAIFGDNAELRLNEEGFHVSASGDVGEGHLTLEPTEDRDMSLEGDSVDASYAMKYLQQIIKHASSLANYMELSFDENQPLRVTTRFGKESHFIAYLAPKVSED